jgi:hypothetical protein
MWLLQGYTHHFGMLWATDQQQQMSRMMDMTGACYQASSAPLKWLLEGHGIKLPSKQLQGEAQQAAAVQLGWACVRLLRGHGFCLGDSPHLYGHTATAHHHGGCLPRPGLGWQCYS